MIRFLPDTWVEALMRPLAMAAPDSNVYAEVAAPDLRFAFAIVAAGVLFVSRRRIAGPAPPTLVLLGFVAIAFVPWLATSGNGRYFMPILLLAGPLCVGLIVALPATRILKASLALMILALQLSLVMSNTPNKVWALATWKDAPYFDLLTPEELRSQPATFVTMTSISYSLIAPQFHPASNWMNVSSMMSDPAASIEARKAHAILAAAQRRFLLVPTMPDHMRSDRQPKAELRAVINRQLGAHRLALDGTRPCNFLPSRTLAQMALGDLEKAKPATLEKLGFWACALEYPVAYQPEPTLPSGGDAVFAKIERDCPRFFPPGSAATRRLPDGAMRDYAGVDMKLYVMDDGGVFYKYWRALNPEKVGSVAEVMAPGFRMDCANIRGRSGLPWQRKI